MKDLHEINTILVEIFHILGIDLSNLDSSEIVQHYSYKEWNACDFESSGAFTCFLLAELYKFLTGKKPPMDYSLFSRIGAVLGLKNLPSNFVAFIEEIYRFLGGEFTNE